MAHQIALAGSTTLSINEAILLAVRSNPNVQSSELSHVSQKFNLWVQEWQFLPHYNLQAIAASNRSQTLNQRINGSQTYNVQPSVNLLTPIGTQLTLGVNNNYTDHYNPGLSFQIMQPLMRGFGTAIVESALCNAKDSEVISRLSVEGTLRSTVSSVIEAYLNVVSAERTVLIDNEAVKRAETSVEQTKLFIKAGHKAGNELVTVQADVASAKMQLENDRNSLLQARYGLLSAIGVDPNSDITFSSLDLNALIKKYHPVSLTDAKKLVLENDIQYQVDQITLYGPTTRSLLVAEDNARWQLNATANVVTGNSRGGGYNAGVNSIFNGANQSQNVGITLQVPIYDQQAKQAIVNAKISLKQAELGLKQEKWNKETGAINGWNLVGSALRALNYAEDAEKLQQKTYSISYQKYLHGLIDSLSLQQAQLQLIQSQQSLLSARIVYLKSLVNLDLLIGHTLNTWNVQVRL
ncbi:MAG: TolC family protein [Gammaproteobacteria bacterium]